MTTTVHPALMIDPIPADHDRYGPLPADYAVRRMFGPPPAGGWLDWTRSADTDVRYVHGHHTVEAVNRDLAVGGEKVAEMLGHGWERCYRHEFTCADPEDGCTCDPRGLLITKNVPEGADGAYPVTAVRVEGL